MLETAFALTERSRRPATPAAELDRYRAEISSALLAGCESPSVKGGENVNVTMIRDLGHVVERERAKMGIFITLAEPTKPMQTEAVKAGFYETDYGKYPKLQIFTIEELLSGKKPQLPLLDPTAFKKAAKEDLSGSKQTDLDL